MIVQALFAATLGVTPYPDIENDAARVEALLSGEGSQVHAGTGQPRMNAGLTEPAPNRDLTTVAETAISGRINPGDLARATGLQVELFADRNTQLRGILTDVGPASVTIRVRRAGGTATLELARERIRYAVVE